jgi:hypothetical protein
VIVHAPPDTGLSAASGVGHVGRFAIQKMPRKSDASDAKAKPIRVHLAGSMNPAIPPTRHIAWTHAGVVGAIDDPMSSPRKNSENKIGRRIMLSASAPSDSTYITDRDPEN